MSVCVRLYVYVLAALCGFMFNGGWIIGVFLVFVSY